MIALSKQRKRLNVLKMSIDFLKRIDRHNPVTGSHDLGLKRASEAVSIIPVDTEMGPIQ